MALLFDDIVKIEKFNPYHGKDGRFASADGAASFTYAPGKSVAHDKAIAREKDRTMRKEFGEKINAMGESINTYDPKELVTVGKEVYKEIDRRFKQKLKSGETEYEEPQEEDIYDVLKDIRSFGPGEYADKIVYGGEIDESRTKEIVEAAMNRFPTEWYQGAENKCGIMINDYPGRGAHFIGYDGGSEIQVYARENPTLVKDLNLSTDVISNKGIANVVVHELGHYFERSNSSVGEAARSFYNHRTKNSKVTEMYGGEYTKADRFADEYMGKVYASDSTEITSVLSQKLGYYNPKQSITTDLFSKKKDVQSYYFILGMMAVGGKTE